MIPAFRSLVEMLRYRAEVQGGARAYTFLLDGEIEEATLTYRELDERMRGIAATLRALGIGRGERALLLYPPGLEFIAAFMGCLAAGVIAIGYVLAKARNVKKAIDLQGDPPNDGPPIT